MPESKIIIIIIDTMYTTVCTVVCTVSLHLTTVPLPAPGGPIKMRLTHFSELILSLDPNLFELVGPGKGYKQQRGGVFNSKLS